jgi:large conductance mechanosensitive channel
MSYIKEFKEFALKGNVVDLAVAVIIGAAFGVIVSSLVEDVITPLLLTPALEAAHAQELSQLSWGPVKYGKFLSSVITFIIIAAVLFFLIQVINRLKRNRDANADVPPIPELTLTEKLLSEINKKLDNLKS